MSKQTNYSLQAPKWPMQLLKRIIKNAYMEELEGDMQERFEDNVELYGIRKAKRLYIIDSFKLLSPALLRRPGGDYKLNMLGILSSNFKIAWRQMLKQRVLSTIKIGGFSFGIAACILIALYINHQTSYDQHYEDGDRIFRVANQWTESGEQDYWTSVHGPLKQVFEDHIPEMEKVARVVTWPWGNAGENHIRIENSANNHYERGFFYADPELLEILEIPMVFGSQTEALTKPQSIVISKKKAESYFKGENPIGKTIVLNNGSEHYVIDGVMEDFPPNSHLQGDFILTLFGRKHGPGTSGWCCTNYALYCKLSDHADKLEVEEKTALVRKSLVMDKLREVEAAGIEEMEKYQSYYLQPVSNIYLNPEEVGDYLSHGSPDLVNIFGLIAIVILLLACINFVNLSIGNSLSRAKEVGLRKVVGSAQSGLIFQFLTESIMYSFLAVTLGILTAWMILPYFSELTGYPLTMPWDSAWFLPSLVGTSLLLGLFSGIYPAFVLSRFLPIDALRGKMRSSISSKRSAGSWIQNSMVVFQFTATVVLIIGTLVIHRQFDYIMNKPLGYEKDQVVNLLGLNTIDENKRQALKEELLKTSVIQNASLSDFLPVEGGRIQNRNFWVSGQKELNNGFEAARWVVDESYIPTMKMEILSGRNFIKSANEDHSMIINERMARALGIENPVGTQVVDMFGEEHKIIGIVKDFHFELVIGDLRPLAMVHGNGESVLSVKLQSKDVHSAIEDISGVWDSIIANQTIRFSFMDQQFERMYLDFHRAQTIFLVFAILSVIIACSGLFALSLYLMGEKVKEICIRKVLGASTFKLVISLTSGFLKLVIVSIVIATPVAWVFSEYLLEWMVNRIDISWSFFVIGALLAILIAAATVSFEAIKVALSNPADQLRAE